jgi:mono/diheme cytochrome c family protein
VWLLRNDPMTQGPRLFARHCASCHRYEGHNGLGAPLEDPQSAPDLKGFASREWINGLLDPSQVDTPKYFGPNMKAHTGKMVEYVKETVKENLEDEQDKADLHKIVVALAAEARLPAEHDANARDATLVSQGREAMSAVAFDCTSCHNFHEKKASLGGANRGPDLTGYGSRQWQIDFIKNPAHPRFYGLRNDRMPLYGEQKILDDRQIALIVDWLRGDEAGSTGASVAPAPTPPSAAPATPAPTPVTTAPAPATPAPEPASTAPAPEPPATAPATTPAATAPAATAPAATAPAATAPAATGPATTAPAATAPAPAPAKEPADKKPDRKELESEFE